jgi:hypothetical protein
MLMGPPYAKVLWFKGSRFTVYRLTVGRAGSRKLNPFINAASAAAVNRINREPLNH